MSKLDKQFGDSFITVQDSDKPPQLSILMPIHNCQGYIQEALLSVLAQQRAIAEIIISDDASTDSTFNQVLETIEQWLEKTPQTHRIVLRRGSERLRRDHLHLLVNKASCDIVCQAHGDDISNPLRAAYLLGCFSTSQLRANMVFINPDLIGGDGRLLRGLGVLPEQMGLSKVTYEMIFGAHDALIGATMAWRKSVLSQFPQLTTNLAAFGHDRVMAFRSYLLGGCFLINAPLIKRRIHHANWSKNLFQQPKAVQVNFGGSLVRLSFFSRMKEDLEIAHNNCWISANRFQLLKNLLEGRLEVSVNELLDSTSALTRLGYTVNWDKNE